MKAILLTGIKRMEVRDIPEPKIQKDTDVLLKIEMVGVCGSDVHYYETGKIGSQIVKYPFIIGHECSATVVAVGKSVIAVKVGDEVVVDPAVSCHNCAQCKMGRENTCYNLQFLGTPGQSDGCLCEYIVIPQNCCYPTNRAITLEQAALCEPFAIGVYSVKQSHISKNSKIAILGAGPIGLSCMAAAQAKGTTEIYMTDILQYRVDIAKKVGATWAGNPEKSVLRSNTTKDEQDIVKEILRYQPLGLDIVFECAGKQETIDQAVELLRPGGKLIIVGIPRFERVTFSIDKIRRKEITIINIRRQNECTQKAIDLLASGKVNLDFMITHRFRFEQTQQAFDMIAEYRDGVVKALIEI